MKKVLVEQMMGKARTHFLFGNATGRIGSPSLIDHNRR